MYNSIQKFASKTTIVTESKKKKSSVHQVEVLFDISTKNLLFEEKPLRFTKYRLQSANLINLKNLYHKNQISKHLVLFFFTYDDNIDNMITF